MMDCVAFLNISTDFQTNLICVCSAVLRFFRRCASTSQEGPSRPPIQTNPPQNNAATDSTDEKMDTNYIGGSLFTNYI